MILLASWSSCDILQRMKTINLAYKFKLVPTSVHESHFSSWAGTCRFLYNVCLEHRIVSWNQYRKSVSYYDQANELKTLKRMEGFEWIKDAPAQILQQAMRNCDRSFKNFFHSSFGFPKFKRKGQGDSFRFPDPKQFSLRTVSRRKAFLKLPKIGEVALRLSRPVMGKIKNATVKRESDGWYVSFCCEQDISPAQKHLPSVGIDRGISESFVLSSDAKDKTPLSFSLPLQCKEIRKRIQVLQRRLRKKKRFSKKWQQAQKEIRKLHAKISKIRHDFLHKASTFISKNHGYVVLEDLKIKNMSKSARGSLKTPGKRVTQKSGLNREILFQGWGIFANQLNYKLEWRMP